MKKITMTQIARLAGVSQPVVSSVINNSPYNRPSPQTREKILKIIRKYNFQPNLTAQSLKKGKTNSIGVTTGGANFVRVFAHPYMSRIYAGIAAGLENTNYRLVFCHFKQIVTSTDALQLASSRFADGIIYILLSVYLKQFKKDKIVEEYNKLGIPYVIIHSLQQDLGANSIGLDCVYGGMVATEHLIQHGYADQGGIGFVQVNSNIPHINNLFKGYKKALKKHNIKFKAKFVYLAHGFHYSAGEEVVKQILQNKVLPRALLVSGSGLTFTLMKGLKKAGINVPDDIAIVGFDEYPMAEFVEPQITYIEQPAFQKGREATLLLLKLIEAKEKRKKESNLNVYLKPRLIIGKSCGC